MDMQNYDFLQVSLVDINGILRSKTLPFHKVAKAENTGVPFFGGSHMYSMRGELVPYVDLKPLKFPNQVGRIDWATISSKPWDGGECQVNHVLADMYWWNECNQQYQPHTTCSRALAKTALKELRDIGYSIYSAFEYEFQILHAKTHEPLMLRSDMLVDHSIPMKCKTFLYQAIQTLHKGSIDIECFHREYADGQVEMPLSAQFGILSADMAVKFKSAMKELGQANDYLITFMTQVLPNNSANAAHFNFSLWDAHHNTNVLFDSNNEDNLSQIGQNWLAGIMSHLPALVAICSPTVNCYRRLSLPWTPQHLTWGVDDRSGCIRVKNKSMEGSYFENRLVSGAANPYAVLAAVVFAGLDGIMKQMTLPKSSESVGEMPQNLEEALQFLEKDAYMMEKLGKFGEWFISNKREFEVKRFGHHDMKEFLEDEMKTELEEYLVNS